MIEYKDLSKELPFDSSWTIYIQQEILDAIKNKLHNILNTAGMKPGDNPNHLSTTDYYRAKARTEMARELLDLIERTTKDCVDNL